MRAIRALLLLSLASIAVSASAQPEASPEQVARQYFQAIKADGIGATTDFMSSAALTEFKTLMMEVVSIDQTHGGQFSMVIFGPDSTFDSVNALTPFEFMGRFMNFLEVQMQSAGVRWDSVEVLGTIAEAERRHVVTRVNLGAGAIELSEMEVLTLVDDGGEWKMALTGEIKGIARQLRVQLASASPQDA